MRPLDVAVCRRGRDRRVSIAPRALARVTARTTRCRVAGPGWISPLGRRDDGDHRRPRRQRIRASAAALWRSGRSTIATTCRARAATAGRPPGAARSAPRSGRPFPAVWAHLTAQHGPRDAARIFAKILGHLETPRRGRRRAGAGAALARHAAAARPRAARRAPALAREAVPASLRDLEIGSGVAADYDALAAGRCGMSTPTITRDLIVGHTRALKLPGRGPQL